MSWKECHVVDERLRFVARLLDGEKMTAVCAAFGISHKTGYKIFDRYKDYGVHGLSDRSRRPYRHSNQQEDRDFGNIQLRTPANDNTRAIPLACVVASCGRR